jgi:hypothetical protein
MGDVSAWPNSRTPHTTSQIPLDPSSSFKKRLGRSRERHPPSSARNRHSNFPGQELERVDIDHAYFDNSLLKIC